MKFQKRWSILSNANVFKKLCNDIVNPTDLWSSISLISETGSLKVTLSGRVPGNIFCFWINSSNQLWPQRTDLSGPKESFCNQEEISIQIGSSTLVLFLGALTGVVQRVLYRGDFLNHCSGVPSHYGSFSFPIAVHFDELIIALGLMFPCLFIDRMFALIRLW